MCRVSNASSGHWILNRSHVLSKNNAILSLTDRTWAQFIMHRCSKISFIWTRFWVSSRQAQPALVFSSKIIGNHPLNQNCAKHVLVFPFVFWLNIFLFFRLVFYLEKVNPCCFLSVKLQLSQKTILLEYNFF